MAKTNPSLRQKHRYVFFTIHSEGPIPYQEMKNAVMDSILSWLGEAETGRATVWVIRNLWNGRTKTGVIRCSHTAIDMVKVALMLIHQIADQRVIFQTVRVSGTIKSGKEKMRKTVHQ